MSDLKGFSESNKPSKRIGKVQVPTADTTPKAEAPKTSMINPDVTQERSVTVETSGKSGIDGEAAKILKNMGILLKDGESQPVELGDSDSEEGTQYIHTGNTTNPYAKEKPLTAKELRAIEREEYETLLGTVTKDNYVLPGFIEYFFRFPLEKELEVMGITEDQLLEVTDSLITKGYYTKTHSLRGKVTFVLRSKDAESYIDTLEAISKLNIARLRAVEYLALNNCAASLIQYGDTVFAPLKSLPKSDRKGELERRVGFLLDLPAAVYGYLTSATAKFDLMVNLAASPAMMENF